MTRMPTLTVWKSVLRPTPLQTIDVPEASEFLSAREENGEICVWYRCSPTAPTYAQGFSIVGNGEPAGEPESWRYLGTALLPPVAFHVFVMKMPLPEPFVGELEPVPEDD